MRTQISQLANKLQELDNDRTEHSLVVNTISKLDPNRRCFRQIGGVLVERTIKEVLPAVQKNLERIDGLIAKVTEQLKHKEKEADDYRIKYNISFSGDDAAQSSDTDRASDKEGGSGVLVRE